MQDEDSSGDGARVFDLWVLGFRVLGFRVWGLVFGEQGLGFRVLGF